MFLICTARFQPSQSSSLWLQQAINIDKAYIICFYQTRKSASHNLSSENKLRTSVPVRHENICLPAQLEMHNMELCGDVSLSPNIIR